MWLTPSLSARIRKDTPTDVLLKFGSPLLAAGPATAASVHYQLQLLCIGGLAGAVQFCFQVEVHVRRHLEL